MKVDGGDESNKPKIPGEGGGFKLLPGLPDPLPLFGNGGDEGLRLEAVQGGQGHPAGEGVGGIAVAVVKSPWVLPDGLVDALPDQCCREREVAPRQGLADCHEIGRDPLLFAGEEGPRPAETCGHLVRDQGDVEVS